MFRTNRGSVFEETDFIRSELQPLCSNSNRIMKRQKICQRLLNRRVPDNRNKAWRPHWLVPNMPFTCSMGIYALCSTSATRSFHTKKGWYQAVIQQSPADKLLSEWTHKSTLQLSLLKSMYCSCVTLSPWGTSDRELSVHLVISTQLLVLNKYCEKNNTRQNCDFPANGPKIQGCPCNYSK